jgi:hypothetical protein
VNDLHKALGEISSIRRQMARSTEFRGYGPATLAATGAFAVVAGIAQHYLLPTPAADVRGYLTLWIATAVVCAALSGQQMYTRARRMHSGLSEEMIRMAVVQFLPSVAAGALLTVVLVVYVPTATWLIPGLWQVVFSLGIFASCRFLPRALAAVGAWYLFTGLFCIALGDARSFAPWAMSVPFGAGQSLVAAILYFAGRGRSDEA